MLIKRIAQALEQVPSLTLTVTDHAVKGYHLDVSVRPETVLDAVRILDGLGFFLESISGVDWIKENEMEVVYDLSATSELCRVVLRVRLGRGAPELPSISSVFAGANWHERETHDFFGIRFTGHPNLAPLLLPEDACFHPLRKDFVA